MMVFCEHFQTVGSTKLGSFFTSYQVFMTLWLPQFCLLFYCRPVLSVNQQKVLGTTNIPCNNMCNMSGRDYKELLYAGDGNEQPQGKNTEGQYM